MGGCCPPKRRKTSPPSTVARQIDKLEVGILQALIGSAGSSSLRHVLAPCPCASWVGRPPAPPTRPSKAFFVIRTGTSTGKLPSAELRRGGRRRSACALLVLTRNLGPHPH